MKRLIFLVACMIMVNHSFAQKYYPQPELNKFNGTWKYSTNNQTFRIVLKIKKKSMKGIRFDVIEGSYIYLQNNKVVQSTMDSSKPNIINGSIANKEKSLNRIQFLFYDPVMKKIGIGYLELMPGKTDEALWTLRNKETVTVDRDNNHLDSGFSVPTKLTLHRVK